MTEKLNLKICKKCSQEKHLVCFGNFYTFECGKNYVLEKGFKEKCCQGILTCKIKNKPLLTFEEALENRPNIKIIGKGYHGCLYELEHELSKLNRKKSKE